MKYQMYNIINIKPGKASNVLKKLIPGVFFLFEIMMIISVFSSENLFDGILIALSNSVLFVMMTVVFYLELGYEHRDRVLLFLDFDEDKLTMTYPNTGSRKKGEKVIECPYDKIISLQYDETLRILIINYLNFEKTCCEVLYLQENNAEEFLRIINKQSGKEIDQITISDVSGQPTRRLNHRA